MSRMREMKEHVRGLLEESGIGEYEFGHAGSCHARVVFQAHGQRITFTFPCTPGDRRAFLNTTTDFRKRLRSAAERATLPAGPEARPAQHGRQK